MAGTDTSYDEIPYDGGASTGSHPRRLATLGRVFGLTPAAPSNCRVLELGCALGTNLIHMAASQPGSEFVGIDLFESQIAEARRRATALGLTNIRFEAADIMEFGEGEAPFDYIVACGVFSWVPPAVQARMLELCDRLLTPEGIAYFTYNILPGWYMRLPVRDLMLMGAGEAPLEERVRRSGSILDFVSRAAVSAAEHDARGDKTFALVLNREREILTRQPVEYVAHEHLERNNHPVYFKDFAAMADAHGLQYLADTNITTMFPTELDAEFRDELNRVTDSQVGMEQLLDFVRGRQFRQTLLCRKAMPIQRNIDLLSLDGFWLSVTGHMVEPGDETYEEGVRRFRDGQSVMRLGDPQIADVVEKLAKARPGQVSFTELVQQDMDEGQRSRIEKILIRMYLNGMLVLDVAPVALGRGTTERPRVSPAAIVTRSRAEVVNLLHRNLGLSPVASILIELADGTRDRAQLVSDLRSGLERANAGESLRELLASPGAIEKAVDDAIGELAAEALLLPE